MNHKKNILILVNNIENSGLVRGATAIFSGMLSRGTNVYLAVLGHKPLSCSFVDIDNERLIFLNSPGFLGLFNARRGLKRLVKDNNIRYVFSYGFRSNILSASMKKVVSVGVVMASCIKEANRLNNKSKIKSFFLSLFQYLVLGMHQVVIYATNNMIDYDRKNYFIKPKKFISLPINPLDEVYISRAATIDNPDNKAIMDFLNRNKIVLCTISVLNKRKNISKIIEGIIYLRDSDINVSLIIIGDGEERADLEKLVTENSLEDQIFFTGYMDNPLWILKKSNGFIMASKAEGFPVAALEAMFLGVPVFLPDLPGFKDCVPGDAGIVYSRDNFETKLSDFINSIVYKKFNPKIISHLSQYSTVEQYINFIETYE
jgi:glycosyltransferase involved in cell wall biosynthesis